MVHEFEQIREKIAASQQPSASDQRKPVWFAGGEKIGIARDQSGRFEIFLAVAGLQVTSAVIQRYVSEDSWRRADGQEFAASRIVIPGDPHFIGVAALIVDELLRNGFDSDPQLAFVRSEALIEMALERAGVSDESVLGLLGELILLEQTLVLHPSPGIRHRVLDVWTGYQRASRDFSGNGVSIEVKATTRNRSRHHISNLDQVTPGSTQSGSGGDALFLVSVGLIPSQTSGRSVASQADRICQLLARDLSTEDAARLCGAFLQCLRRYGVAPGGGVGYDHDLMKAWPMFASEWEIRFLRVYDMSDELLLIARRGEFARFQHMVEGSLRFEVDLPDVVRGDINPSADATEVVRRLLA
ncbi:MAG: PD-(D/E)XK motif protein [Phycisphaera sp.]|nr:PD-(D/E)XK motif protein [Phycisphaera sp.]